ALGGGFPGGQSLCDISPTGWDTDITASRLFHWRPCLGGRAGPLDPRSPAGTHVLPAGPSDHASPTLTAPPGKARARGRGHEAPWYCHTVAADNRFLHT